jgi:hypothetical protein
MFKNRILIVLGVCSLLLVTMAVSRPFSSQAVSVEGANDFYQRHRDWNRNMEGSDYIERHPSMQVPAASIVDRAGDFALRHPEWTVSVPNAAVPVTSIFEDSDYFQRHPELREPATIDLSDYFQRH